MAQKKVIESGQPEKQKPQEESDASIAFSKAYLERLEGNFWAVWSLYEMLDEAGPDEGRIAAIMAPALKDDYRLLEEIKARFENGGAQ